MQRDIVEIWEMGIDNVGFGPGFVLGFCGWEWRDRMQKG